MPTLKFSLAEASAITGISLRKINKAIERRTIELLKINSPDSSQRALDQAALLCLSLESKGLENFPPKIRKKVYRHIMENPRLNQIRQGEAVIVDITPARREIVRKMIDLRNAKSMVVRNPEILSGTPVFRGTRVPVYPIAEMRAKGVPVAEILDGYPTLSEEMIRLSELYAKAVPKRGRPLAKPPGSAEPSKPRAVNE